MKKPCKAVALLSGGLDSMLAARIVQDQGVEVIGVHFSTGFCTVQRRRRVARPSDLESTSLRNEALSSAATLQIPIELIDVADEYLPIVLNPKHGYGAHMNPCQDCRAFMLSKAKAFMEEINADFIVTGEVVGQRPNSQKRHLLYQTEKESDLKGRILRPLSAKLLRPSVAEEMGCVNRNALYAISGRGRKEQIAMAAQFGISDFAQPAGGCCLLVDEAFSLRLQDYLQHNSAENLDQFQVGLLSVGRHLRLPDRTKIIVGRHEGENNYLDRVRRPEHWRLEVVGGGSPVAILNGPLSPEQVDTAAAIVAGYSRAKREPSVSVEVQTDQEAKTVTVTPLSQDKLWALNVGAKPSSWGVKRAD